MTQSCVVCGACTDAFLCGDDRAGTGCLGLLMQRLGDCAALVDELNTTLSRQDKLGSASVGFVSNGGDEQPLPINLRATEAGIKLRDLLCSWARDLWETHALRDEDGSLPTVDVQPTIISVSRWLMRHPTWIALHTAADELFREISDEIRSAWRAVDTAPGKSYVGPCLSESEGVVCNDDLYAREGYPTVRCRTCSAEHDNVHERKNHLSGAVEKQYVPIGVLVGLVTERGHGLTTSAIRNLKARKRIAAYVVIEDGDEGAGVIDEYGFRVRPRTTEDEGRTTLYLVREVLNAVTPKQERTAA